MHSNARQRSAGSQRLMGSWVFMLWVQLVMAVVIAAFEVFGNPGPGTLEAGAWLLGAALLVIVLRLFDDLAEMALLPRLLLVLLHLLAWGVLAVALSFTLAGLLDYLIGLLP